MKRPTFFKILVIFLISGLICCRSLSAQERIGFFLPDGVDKVSMPFEELSNLVVVPVTINNFLTLKFILDTGAESAILTEKIFGDVLGLNYVRDINIQGPGLVDSLQAFVATNIQMRLPGGIQGRGLNMLVLKEDYLELNKNLGEEVYGIIGYDLFNRFVIDINYDEDIITITRPEAFKPRRSSTVLPMRVSGTKPFVNVLVSQDSKTDTVNLLVDTGASHAMLLDVRNTDDIVLPDKLISSRLGQGLGGEIPGFIGRMQRIKLGDFSFEEVLVSIPIDGAYIKAIKRGSRHGTIGGDLLSRFDVTFNYPQETIYLDRSKNFNDPFEFDMSGLTLGVEGKKLDSLIITRVRPNTPAAEAGLKEDDYVVKINNLNLLNAKVSEINALLRRRDGLRIKAVIRRNGEKMKIKFRLRRMI